jgi:hypothetical protein
MSTDPPDPQTTHAPEPEATEPEATEPIATQPPAAKPTAAPAATTPRPATTLTWVLVGVALVVAGFVGGYFMGHQGNGPGDRSAFMHHRFGDGHGEMGPRFGGFPGTGNSGGVGGVGPQIGGPQGGFPMQGDFVVGTVTRVSGSTVYLRERDGTSLTVDTNASTDVRVPNGGGVSSLQPGSAVVVRGTPGGKGAIEATFIAQVGRYSSATATT